MTVLNDTSLTKKSFADELKRIQALDQRDGYQDEPLAKLISQLSACHDCDDLLTQALFQQASCQVYQSAENLLDACEKLLVRLNQYPNKKLQLKTLYLLAQAQYKLKKNAAARNTLNDLIQHCENPSNKESVDQEIYLQSLYAYVARANYADDDKQQAVEDYSTVIDIFGKSTDPEVIERVAYSRYQLGLINFQLGNEQLGRYHLEELCSMELHHSLTAETWVERAKQRLKI